MKITKNNYYSPEVNQEYVSASFVKQFLNCEARAVAEFDGSWKRPESTALLVGNYVDSYFEGKKSHNNFIAENPSIFNSRTGELKSDFKQADIMLKKAKADKLFMQYMKGQKQKIFTGTICGIKFKCKLDVYLKHERIVDLKTVKDFSPVYKEGYGKVNFAEAWEWPLQLAIYQELVRQNTGEQLPCYLACITKQDPPDIGVFQIPQQTLDAQMQYLNEILPRTDAVRSKAIQGTRCESCAYCRETKKLSKVQILEELVNE